MYLDRKCGDVNCEGRMLVESELVEEKAVGWEGERTMRWREGVGEEGDG